VIQPVSGDADLMSTHDLIDRDSIDYYVYPGCGRDLVPGAMQSHQGEQLATMGGGRHSEEVVARFAFGHQSNAEIPAAEP